MSLPFKGKVELDIRDSPPDRDAFLPAGPTSGHGRQRAPGMRWVPEGTFAMGSEVFYPEERPVRRVSVDGFWMDEAPVTAADFRRFVRGTGYIALAERAIDPADYSDADPELLVPGSLVFASPPARSTCTTIATGGSTSPARTGRSRAGRAPRSTGAIITRSSTSPTRTRRPTPRGWAKELPTEAEWEFAARGGLEGAVFTWGDEHFPDGNAMANTWQGEFPWQDLKLDGFEGTSPVGSFPPNGNGLSDMAGNVWEWTSDSFTSRHPEEVESPCCVPHNPRAASPDVQSGEAIPRRVIKGGSHLCAPNYCLRYRPAARQGQAIDSSTGHLGFRCIVRESGAATRQDGVSAPR